MLFYHQPRLGSLHLSCPSHLVTLTCPVFVYPPLPLPKINLDLNLNLSINIKLLTEPAYTFSLLAPRQSYKNEYHRRN
jgi:hypothetical protein